MAPSARGELEMKQPWAWKSRGQSKIDVLTTGAKLNENFLFMMVDGWEIAGGIRVEVAEGERARGR